jgi:hypothetical protein
MTPQPDQMQTEMDVLTEKIEAIESLLKQHKAGQRDVDSYLDRKLTEYKTTYTKLSDQYSALYGS